MFISTKAKFSMCLIVNILVLGAGVFTLLKAFPRKKNILWQKHSFLKNNHPGKIGNDYLKYSFPGEMTAFALLNTYCFKNKWLYDGRPASHLNFLNCIICYPYAVNLSIKEIRKYVDLKFPFTAAFAAYAPAISLKEAFPLAYTLRPEIKMGIPNQQANYSDINKKEPRIAKVNPGSYYTELNDLGGEQDEINNNRIGKREISAPPIHSPNNFKKINTQELSGRRFQSKADVDTIFIETHLLYQTLLRGNIANDTVVLVAASNDINNIPRYRISGKLYARDKYFSFSLSDSVLLNYENWQVSPGNNILNSADGIVIKNLILTKDSARLSANSQIGLPNNPVDITLQNFNIRDIAAIFSRDTSLAVGYTSGQLMLSGIGRKHPAFTGNIEVSNMYLMNAFFGNFRMDAIKQNDTTIHTTVHITGEHNEIGITGNYHLNNDRDQFDAIIDIKKFPVANLQRFTQGFLSHSKGNMYGIVEMNGTFAQPRWKGEINFDSTKFGITQFGTNYTMNGQKVILDYPVINFNHLTVMDSLNNPLIINGTLHSCSATEYDVALDIKTANFNLINAPKAINNQIYGNAVVDADVSLTGTTASPHIKGNISMGKNSEVTMILPEKSVDKDAARSLVRFIDRDSFNFSERELSRPLKEPVVNISQFLNPDLRINITNDATMTIVIDPSAGDELKVQGEGQLNVGMDSGNNILLGGKYKFNSGYYALNYEFLKKRFTLLEGSTMQFAGGANSAQINIRAEYIANTSPKELLCNEVGSVDPRIAKLFNQTIPFRVVLYLNGSLMKPLVRFDIQLAQQEKISNQLRITIQNKLIQLRGDTAATNKQVFALLALERFVGEQSTDFFKGNSGEFNDLASESVSRFLSDALDQIASDLFKGINIDLNLNSYQDFADNNGAQKSDLSVDVSKNFLNDRLNVTVGKNFGIEGQDGSAKAAKQKGSRFLPDVTVNYKLSKDGKYMMKGYSKNQLEVILDGYVVETGVGFIVTMDYDKFNELFMYGKKADL